MTRALLLPGPQVDEVFVLVVERDLVEQEVPDLFGDRLDRHMSRRGNGRE